MVSSSSIRLRRAWAKRGRAKLATSASFVEACESASFGRYRVSVSLQSRVANLWSLKLLFAKLRKRVFMYTPGAANAGSYYQQLLPRLAPNNALQHATGKIGGSPGKPGARSTGERFRFTSRLRDISRRAQEARLLTLFALRPIKGARKVYSSRLLEDAQKSIR